MTPPDLSAVRGEVSPYEALGVSEPAENEALRCRCFWNGSRCPNRATQEDMLCDWCGPHGRAMAGGSELHVDPSVTPDACWMQNSGQAVDRG